MPKRKITLKNVVEAAHAAGAKVSVSLEPKEPVSTEPLRRMAEDMEAIWLLCETRSQYGLDAAQRMLRRISFNDAQMCLVKLQQEWRQKPALESRVLPSA